MPHTTHSKLNIHLPFDLLMKRPGINEHAALYLTNTLRSFSVSIVGIFLPIYIFEISPQFLYFSSNEMINGVSWVLTYFLLRSFMVWMALLLFADKVFSKWHFQTTMLLSYVFLVGEIILWHLAKNHLGFILIAGLVAGFKTAFYWMPYHIFFLRKADMKKGHFGKKTGFRFFLGRVFSGIAPIVGGFIIQNYGFNTLFLCSISLLIVSALPIAIIVHEWKHGKHNSVSIIRSYFFEKKFAKLVLSYMGEGVEAAIYAIFWPILLFLALNNFVKIGFINSLSLVVSSVLVLYIGRLIDKKGTKGIHRFGAVANALSYIPRMFINSPPLFYVQDLIDRLVSGTYALPTMSLTYEKARKLGGSDYIIFREFAIHGGIILTSSIVLMAFQFITVWKWVFVLAMIGTLLSYLIELDKN